VAWGISYSGGHVLDVAAKDPRIAAVVSVTPGVDGHQTFWSMLRLMGPVATAAGLAMSAADKVGAALKLPPLHLQIAGAPRDDDGRPSRTRFCARATLDIITNRPITVVDQVRCPLLVQIALEDEVAPPAAAEQAAAEAGGEVRVHRYPLRHFEIFTPEARERLLSDQIAFLTSHLDPNQTRLDRRPDCTDGQRRRLRAQPSPAPAKPANMPFPPGAAA
jgi:pimeloyl-ACP methyl ester carboxylesterase